LPEHVLAAIEQAKSWQSEAWVSTEFLIDSVWINQMTLRHFFMLDGAGSPFLTGKQVTSEDIAVFLWILSPEYKPCPEAREKFCASIIDVNIEQAMVDIGEFFEITFADADTDEGKPKEYASFVAYMVDMFASEYGWSAQTILDMPMRQIYQLASVIGERYAKQNGKKYTKLRNIDMIKAKAALDAARAAKAVTE